MLLQPKCPVTGERYDLDLSQPLDKRKVEEGDTIWVYYRTPPCPHCGQIHTVEVRGEREN